MSLPSFSVTVMSITCIIRMTPSFWEEDKAGCWSLASFWQLSIPCSLPAGQGTCYLHTCYPQWGLQPHSLTWPPSHDLVEQHINVRAMHKLLAFRVSMKSVENESFLGFLPISQALLTQEHCVKDSKGKMNKPNDWHSNKVACQRLLELLYSSHLNVFLFQQSLCTPQVPIVSPHMGGSDGAEILIQQPLNVDIWIIIVHLPQVTFVILALRSLSWHVCFKFQSCSTLVFLTP